MSLVLNNMKTITYTHVHSLKIILIVVLSLLLVMTSLFVLFLIFDHGVWM